jgi:hypothetical protein
VHSLASEDTGFETLVIDTLDRAEWLCHQHVCELARVPSIEKVGKFGAGWTAAYEHFRGFAKRLEEIRARRRMKIILISHSKVEKVPNAAGTTSTAGPSRSTSRSPECSTRASTPSSSLG